MARQVLFSLFEISTYCDQFLSDYEYNSLWNKNYKIADRLSSYCLYNAIFSLKYQLLNWTGFHFTGHNYCQHYNYAGK